MNLAHHLKWANDPKEREYDPKAYSQLMQATNLQCDIDRIIGERTKEQWLVDSANLSKKVMAESIWQMLRPDTTLQRLEDPEMKAAAGSSSKTKSCLQKLVKKLGHPKLVEDSLMERVATLPDELIVIILHYHIRLVMPTLDLNAMYSDYHTCRMIKHIPRVHEIYKRELLNTCRFRVRSLYVQPQRVRHIGFEDLHFKAVIKFSQQFAGLQTITVACRRYIGPQAVQDFMTTIHNETKCTVVCVKVGTDAASRETLYISRWKGVKGCHQI